MKHVFFRKNLGVNIFMKKQNTYIGFIARSFEQHTINAKPFGLLDTDQDVALLTGTCKWNKNGMPIRQFN